MSIANFRTPAAILPPTPSATSALSVPNSNSPDPSPPPSLPSDAPLQSTSQSILIPATQTRRFSLRLTARFTSIDQISAMTSSRELALALVLKHYIVIIRVLSALVEMSTEQLRKSLQH